MAGMTYWIDVSLDESSHGPRKRIWVTEARRTAPDQPKLAYDEQGKAYTPSPISPIVWRPSSEHDRVIPVESVTPMADARRNRAEQEFAALASKDREDDEQ